MREEKRVVHCPDCNSTNLATREERESFMYGTKKDELAQLTAIVSVHACQSCGMEFSDESASEARHNAVCRHLGVATPREVRSVRERYGLSQEDFAAVTRLGKASMNRWENGLLIQNPANDLYLFLLSFPDNLERLRAKGLRNLDAIAEKLTGNIVEFRPRFKAITGQELPAIDRQSQRFELFPQVSNSRN